ncbi:MAG TPA: PrpF domain-containing protein [Azospirillaceae bacterium]|nr:PrpF domain-containing protein [Azospirillaceae bacterium]
MHKDLLRNSPSLPYMLMRGGTSRGPLFLAEHLPANRELRDRVLMAAVGVQDPLRVDGVGGESSLTSKVAVVSRSSRMDADVDYLFLQVSNAGADASPSCGNMLAAVGPFAIERGLVRASDDRTSVRVHCVNNGEVVDVEVCTPQGDVLYDGGTRIDGVCEPAAPVNIRYAAPGPDFLTTGNPSDMVEGVEVTLLSAPQRVMLVRASDFGKTGYETPAELDADKGFLARLEAVRRAAGRRMGMGDVSSLATPKPVLLAPPRAGSITSRYFMPHSCHPSHAANGAVAIAAAAATPGTVAHALARRQGLDHETLTIEHPSGTLQVSVDLGAKGGIAALGLVRTARLIAEGRIYLPEALAPALRAAWARTVRTGAFREADAIA